jgi:acetylornithine deacetylase
MQITTREMLARLVAFRTVSRDSNLDCIAFIRDYLAGYGIATTIIPNAEGTKANLYATIGPQVPGGIVLSGHTDVVPVESQAWTTDPWTLTERDGKLYGRGTCDMKGFVATALTAAAAAARMTLARPLYLALSYDEELGCAGAPSMVEAMAASLPLPEAVIVGEPSELRVVSGHKSSLSFFTRVTGHTVHSSEVHRGVSAVMVAARLVTWFDDTMARSRAEADPASPFDPPYTTLHCGQIQGGTAANVVASQCEFVSDIRAAPPDDAWAFKRRYEAYVHDQIEPAMKAIAPDSSVSIVHRGFVPGLRPVFDSPAERLVRAVTGDNGTHVVSYGTEAGIFQNAGWPTVVCGPGNIAQAHQADEFITVAQMEAGERLVGRMIETLKA